MPIEPEAMSPKQSHIAVILANNLGVAGFGSPMPQVGALSILLRSILGARKAGAQRIIVVVDSVKGPADTARPAANWPSASQRRVVPIHLR